MIIRKAYKFRLKVTQDVERQLVNFCGHARFVYNKVLELNMARLDGHQRIIRYSESCAMLKFWKQTDERSFLNECHSQVLQQKLKDLDRAFRDGFDKTQPNKRMPRKHRKGVHDSFRFPQGFKVDNRRIYLPKIGWVGFHKSQEIIGTPKNVTLSRSGNHWFVSVQVECELAVQPHPSNTAIGLDVGVKHFAALSTGDLIPGVHSLRALEKKLTKLQQHISRKVKFSQNWCKLKGKLRALHARIANMRRDFLHKLSTTLSNSHAMIVVEDLKIKNMSASASGTNESPGTHVRAKSGLNKSILDQGWGEFFRQLGYKLDWLGGQLIRVNPRFTSQTCSSCRFACKANRLDRGHFKCQRCGHEDHADINAAKVILSLGLLENGGALAGLACESNPPVGRKQEPLGISNLVPA